MGTFPGTSLQGTGLLSCAYASAFSGQDHSLHTCCVAFVALLDGRACCFCSVFAESFNWVQRAVFSCPGPKEAFGPFRMTHLLFQEDQACELPPNVKPLCCLVCFVPNSHTLPIHKLRLLHSWLEAMRCEYVCVLRGNATTREEWHQARQRMQPEPRSKWPHFLWIAGGLPVHLARKKPEAVPREPDGGTARLPGDGHLARTWKRLLLLLGLLLPLHSPPLHAPNCAAHVPFEVHVTLDCHVFQHVLVRVIPGHLNMADVCSIQSSKLWQGRTAWVMQVPRAG